MVILSDKHFLLKIYDEEKIMKWYLLKCFSNIHEEPLLTVPIQYIPYAVK